jgi:hypothetical protein
LVDWYIIFGINESLNFVHHPEIYVLVNITFRTLDRWEKGDTLLGPSARLKTERDPVPRNVLFSGIYNSGHLMKFINTVILRRHFDQLSAFQTLVLFCPVTMV